eukprot:1459528-Alexandrium_andersonii.AAC.1
MLSGLQHLGALGPLFMGRAPAPIRSRGRPVKSGPAPQNPAREIAVPVRPMGQAAPLRGSEVCSDAEPRFPEASAGGAALRAAPPAPGSA